MVKCFTNYTVCFAVKVEYLFDSSSDLYYNESFNHLCAHGKTSVDDFEIGRNSSSASISWSAL